MHYDSNVNGDETNEKSLRQLFASNVNRQIAEFLVFADFDLNYTEPRAYSRMGAHLSESSFEVGAHSRGAYSNEGA